MQTECPICLEDFDEALDRYIIPCREGHLICYGCLDSIWQKDDEVSSLECCLLGQNCDPHRRHQRCPMCRDVFHIRDDDIKNIIKIPHSRSDVEALIKSRREKRRKILTTAKMLEKLGLETNEELENLKEEINRVSKNCRIAKVSGSTAGIIGGVMFIVGAALAIPSLGASTPLMIAGGIVSGSGASTALGAGIAEVVETSKTKTKTNDLWEKVQKSYREFVELFHEYSIQSSLLILGLRTISGGLGAVGNMAGVIRLAMIAIDNSADAASAIFRFASTAGRALHIAGIVLSAVMIVFDVVSLIWNSVELANNMPSHFAAKIDEVINTIKENCIENAKSVEETLSKADDSIFDDANSINLEFDNLRLH